MGRLNPNRLVFIASVFALLLSPVVNAQDLQFAPRPVLVPKAKKAGARGATPRGTLDKNLVKTTQRQKVPFKKITLDLINEKLKSEKKGARGQALQVRPGQAINIGRPGARGKQKTITSEEYVNELNTLAEKFAALGYDPFAEGPDDIEVGAIDMEPAALRQQRASFDRSLSRITSLKVPRKPAYLAVRARKGARGAKKYSAGRLLQGAPEYKVDAAAGKPKRGARGSRPKPEEKYEKKIEKSWGPYGSKKTAAVEVKAGLRIFANDKKVSLSAHGGAYGYLFKKKKAIFAAKAELYGDSTTDGGARKKGGRYKGKAVAKVTLTVLGKEKVVFEKKGAGVSFEKEKSISDDFSYTIRFSIGPVPCSVEVGAAFKAGVRFEIALTPVKVSAAVTPFVNADAFARFAIDIVVAKAGIEGRVTLIDAEAKIHGEAGLAGDSNGLFLYAFFAGDLGLEALSGKISAFVKVNWCIFGCSKTYRHKIFGWEGLKKQWRLFKLETPRVYLIGNAPKGVGSANAMDRARKQLRNSKPKEFTIGGGKKAKKGKKGKKAKRKARKAKRKAKKAKRKSKRKARKACKKKCRKFKGKKARQCRRKCK